MMPNKNKDAKKRIIKEDVPEMRSVMMQPRSSSALHHGAPPPPPKQMGLRAPPPMSLRSAPPPMPLRSGVAPPPPMPLRSSGMSPPPMPLRGNMPVKQQQHPNVTRSNKTASTGEWKVVTLVPPPKFYPLERTHVYICNVEPGTVCLRIAKCFQNESIVAEYNDKEATAKAETMNHVLLMVRLFCGGDNKVLVEVQRQKGDKFVFHQVAKTVMKAAAAEGSCHLKGGAPPKMLTRTPPPRRCAPPPPRAISEDVERQTLLESIDISSAMLSQNRMDTNDLAMESLLRATKTPCCKATKACVARKILASDNLWNILMLQIKCCSSSKDDESEDSKEEEADQQVCCRLAMTIFANCLDALEQSKELIAFLKEKETTILQEGLLDALVEQMQTTPEQPTSAHNSCQAARCLHPLVRYSTVAKQMASDIRLLDMAVSSCNLGASSHSMLEKESNLLRLELELGCNATANY